MWSSVRRPFPAHGFPDSGGESYALLYVVVSWHFASAGFFAARCAFVLPVYLFVPTRLPERNNYPPARIAHLVQPRRPFTHRPITAWLPARLRAGAWICFAPRNESASSSGDQEYLKGGVYEQEQA